jgi:hypothetical protein
MEQPTKWKQRATECGSIQENDKKVANARNIPRMMECGHGERQMETELRGRPIRMNRCPSGSQRKQLGQDIKYTPSKYTPGDRQTSRVYCTTLVQCCVPLVAPSSKVVTPIQLYPLYCTLYFCTLARRQPQMLVALSSAFVSDISFQILQCALHWLQLLKCFLLQISLRNHQSFSFQLCSFCWKLVKATTALNCWTSHSCLYFSISVLRSFRPWADIQPSWAHIFVSGYFNPIRRTYFSCVRFQPTFWFCFVLTLPQPSGSHLQTRWFLRHFPWRCHKTVPEPLSYPARRFLHARDQQRLHSLHRCGTRPVNGHRPRGWTSGLFSFQQRPELGGSPVESCLHSWWPSNQSGELHHPCTVPVYKLLCI